MTWIRHVLPFITATHRWLYLRSGGWIGGGALGFRFLLLEHVGRKSGTLRRTPILYVEDEGRYVLAASNAGQARHPAWYWNLDAAPEVDIRVGRASLRVRARCAEAEERPHFWSLLTASYRWFDQYREVAGREIPIIVLEPVVAAPGR